MFRAAASNRSSHPVEVECPCCNSRFRVQLQDLSAGVLVPCRGCQCNIPITTLSLRQLLAEIDKDLRTPNDLPLVLQPPACRPAAHCRTDRARTQPV